MRSWSGPYIDRTHNLQSVVQDWNCQTKGFINFSPVVFTLLRVDGGRRGAEGSRVDDGRVAEGSRVDGGRGAGGCSGAALTMVRSFNSSVFDSGATTVCGMMDRFETVVVPTSSLHSTEINSGATKVCDDGKIGGFGFVVVSTSSLHATVIDSGAITTVCGMIGGFAFVVASTSSSLLVAVAK